MSSQTLPRLAVVGCGAVTERFYLPALRRHKAAAEWVVMVDRDLDRAQRAAESLGGARTARDHHQVVDQVDAAIVAVPPVAHYAVAKSFLERKVHVLCEKPLTVSSQEAEDLVQTAERNRVVLAVNNTRRLFPASIKVKELVQEGAIGSIERLEYQEGGEFSWPAVSKSYFDGDRGVLLDRGAHVLDLVCWWLGGQPSLVEYWDDSFGGTEAVARVTFECGEAFGEVCLSWLTKRANRYRLVGSRGIIEGDIYERNVIRVTGPSGKARTVRLRSKEKSYDDLAWHLVDNFFLAVVGKADPLVSGSDVTASIQLIEECYACRRRFELPWYRDLECGVHS